MQTDTVITAVPVDFCTLKLLSTNSAPALQLPVSQTPLLDFIMSPRQNSPLSQSVLSLFSLNNTLVQPILIMAELAQLEFHEDFTTVLVILRFRQKKKQYFLLMSVSFVG